MNRAHVGNFHRNRTVKTADSYLPVESTKPSSYSWVGDVDHAVETGGGFKTAKLAPLVVTCHQHHTFQQ